MKSVISTLFSQIRDALGLEEILFLLGIVSLYFGLLAEFGHGVAQIVCGGVFISISIFIAIKGSR